MLACDEEILSSCLHIAWLYPTFSALHTQQHSCPIEQHRGYNLAQILNGSGYWQDAVAKKRFSLIIPLQEKIL